MQSTKSVSDGVSFPSYGKGKAMISYNESRGILLNAGRSHRLGHEFVPLSCCARRSASSGHASPGSQGTGPFLLLSVAPWSGLATLFGMVRKMAREGEDTELFISHAACALDDAYRACIDGTTCHPDIAELTQGCHPSFLERLVSCGNWAIP